MAQTGTLIFQVYSARQAIPVKDATITITASGADQNVVVASRITDENGKTVPLVFTTPDRNVSTSPNEERGYTAVDVVISHPMYSQVDLRNVQIFPDEESIQNMELIPLAEFADNSETRVYTIEPQLL